MRKKKAHAGPSRVALDALLRRGGIHRDQRIKSDPKQIRRDKAYKGEHK